MAPNQIQIADEAITRTLSNNGGGTYSQQRPQSIAQVKTHEVTEKELEGERDERDLKMKQVVLACCCLIN